MNTEMESYKRSIVKEQELNEKLTLVLNRTKYEIQNLEKLLQINSEKSETIKQEISTYTKALEETQLMLNRVNNVRSARERWTLSYWLRSFALGKSGEATRTEHPATRNRKRESRTREIRRWNLSEEPRTAHGRESRRLQFETPFQTQRSDAWNRTSLFVSLSLPLLGDFSSQERNLSKVQNDIARARLEKTYLITNIKQLEAQAKEYNEQIVEKNQIITRSEQEIKRRVILIEQKQNQIDLMNKKLENLREKAGGIELGPLELEVLNLQKSITQIGKEIFDLEQTWLKEQNELVRLTNEKDVLEKETDAMKLKHTILMSRKLRTESKTQFK